VSQTGYGPDPPGVRRPSLFGRLVVGLLLLFLLVLLTVGVPVYLLALLGTHGAVSVLGTTQLTVGGLVLSGLTAAAYVLRPTRLYGPVGVTRALGTIVYFLLLAGNASITLPVGANATATVDYASVPILLAGVAAFGLLSAALVSWSDARYPSARLEKEFPANPRSPFGS
jgi:hypothetical protein